MRFPWLFYLVAIALGILVILSYTLDFPRVFAMYILYPLQRCYVAFCFFALVMFIGVLGKGSRIRAYFIPIRAELSLLACIFALIHIVRNVPSFVPRLFVQTDTLTASNHASVLVALLLSLLMLLLGITSFKVVKERMLAVVWKRIQRFAYLFFFLIYLHLGLFLLPSALQGGTAAGENLIIYTVIFLLYAVLRVFRALRERSRQAHLEPVGVPGTVGHVNTPG